MKGLSSNEDSTLHRKVFAENEVVVMERKK